MNRRGFFTSLFGAVGAALAIDPEKLLWVPGKKLISIPKPVTIPPLVAYEVTIETGPTYISLSEIIAAAMTQIGVIAPGQTLSFSDRDFALTRLNHMLDSWKVDSDAPLGREYTDAAIFGLAGRLAPAYYPGDPSGQPVADERSERWINMAEEMVDRKRRNGQIATMFEKGFDFPAPVRA